MIIAATSDIHSPKHITLFEKALMKHSHLLRKIDVFILAGDIIYKGRVRECMHVTKVLRKYYSGIILGIRGNEEYDDRIDKLYNICNEIEWVDDKVLFIEEKGVAVVGSKGALDKPTLWQQKNMPDIHAYYREKLRNIEKLLKEAIQRMKHVILVTHYAPRCKTLIGEEPRIWPFLSSFKLTKIIERYQPTVVIHGHVHRSTNHIDTIRKTRVYNVALPATHRITFIGLERKSLLDFF